MVAKKKMPVVKRLQGVVIEPDGTVTALELDNTLQALWDTIGGYVERVVLVDGADMFVNEDGLRLGLPPNPLADALVKTHQQQPTLGVILGTALILGAVDPKGDSTDVPDWVYEYLTH